MLRQSFNCKKSVSLRSTDRASICAGTALNALVCVDNIFAVAFGDSFNRAFCRTSAAGDAVVRNLICHLNFLLV